jgi:thiol-disulfide isomerase/thioredoxin
MTYGFARVLLAGLLAMLCAWAGAHLYLLWHVPRNAAMRVPAGIASMSTAADDDAADDAKRHAAPTHIPDILPPFTLSTLQGSSQPISAWAGKPLVINFWATWCAPCRREIPLLKSLAGEWAPRNIAVIGIAVDHRIEVQKFADQFHIDYPLLVGEQDALDVAAKFGMDSPAFPFTVFTDARGEVVTLFVGELHRPQADLILSAVQSIDKGSLQLSQAKRQIAEELDALAEKTSPQRT